MRQKRATRRRMLAAGLAAALPNSLIAVRQAMADDPTVFPETVVYVSNAGDPSVQIMAMNRATGELHLIAKMPVPGSDKPSPASMPMALSSNHRFLYAALRSEPFTVASFAIDRLSGHLKHLGNAPVAASMAYTTTDRAGRWLLCASYPGAVLTVNSIDATGRVQAPPTQVLSTEPKAHSILVDASNRFAYSGILGGDIIQQMKFDVASGTLSPNQPASISTKPGAGPRHLTFHPSGRLVYLITETTATIGAYAVNPDNGTLSEVQFVDTGDYNGKDSAAASDIHVTPDGKFLYGAVRTTSTLHGYQIDPDKGTLTPVGKWPTEKTPRGFAIDPRGKFLLSVGMDSNAMTVHAIDPGTGALNPVGHYPTGTQPNWVEIVDLQYGPVR
jgi:6-phosphogluconolactonase